MRVVFASHRYFPVPGGTERSVQLLAEGLVRRGHTATVVTQLEPGTERSERLNGVGVLRIPTRTRFGIRFPQRYLRTLRGMDAELFHLYGNRIWCADFYFPFARLFRWRQVLTGHGFYQYAIHPRRVDRWYFERYFPRVVRAFDTYSCDTEYERQQLLGWGADPGRLTVIPLGIPLDEFARPTGRSQALRDGWGLRAPLVAVYAGGFFENKRVDRLVAALGARAGRWALVALGRDVPESPYNASFCAAQARTLGLEFLAPGAVNREDAVASLLAADVVVQGSEYEGFGFVLVEAMAAGKPFVAFPAGAAPEVAATGGGYLANSVAEFTQRLVELEDESRRAELGRRGRAAATLFSVEAMVDRYEAVYRRLLATG